MFFHCGLSQFSFEKTEILGKTTKKGPNKNGSPMLYNICVDISSCNSVQEGSKQQSEIHFLTSDFFL